MSLRGVLVVSVALGVPAMPAVAATNLIVNGSFETGDFTGFRHVNASGLLTPATVIDYDSAAAYGAGGAFGEAVRPDDAVSSDGEAAGRHGAYFVDDFAVDESLTQLTKLTPGHYEIGFDVYLPHNGFDNPGNATLDGQIIGVDVASFSAVRMGATQWYNVNGVANITQAGWYLTSFTYNSHSSPAKDFVIDKIYVLSTARAATAAIPPTPTEALPEPAGWLLLTAGFGLVGTVRRRSAKGLPQPAAVPS